MPGGTDTGLEVSPFSSPPGQGCSPGFSFTGAKLRGFDKQDPQGSPVMICSAEFAEDYSFRLPAASALRLVAGGCGERMGTH